MGMACCLTKMKTRKSDNQKVIVVKVRRCKDIAKFCLQCMESQWQRLYHLIPALFMINEKN